MSYAAWCNNYLEDEDRPCDGIIVYQEDDREAPCTSCGGRCGYLVADYLPGQTRQERRTPMVEQVEELIEKIADAVEKREWDAEKRQVQLRIDTGDRG